MTTYAEGLTWGEGPRHHAGALWVSDPQGGKLWTDASGTWEGLALDSQSNGLWFLPDGRLAAAMQRECRVGIWDGTGFGEYADLQHVATGPLGDMVGDSQGGLYVDDVGYAAHLGEEPKPGRLIYVRPNGDAVIAAEGIEFPNGLAIIDDGQTLVVAETWRQRLIAFDIDSKGALSNRRPYSDLRATVSLEARPDGICAAEDGGVWVATLHAHTIAHVRENSLINTIDTGDAFPIACCFDAPTSRLYATVAYSGGLPIMEAIARKRVHSTVEVFDV
ncbi:SMP-30/gluconolactonase/LRE family protein [Streptomyces sp. NBC_01727]|uniref:SMP-30/gluconolactonase/LRE family protein n=1 Tax=Streptomyces sp. NBC_01727 TaxID=2975924 RepID=UPI002E1477F5|nr:SMP-30/gluconolactonase/LRE family protein [Streptomyces sp. NBC_01727]